MPSVRPLFSALDSFLREVPHVNKRAPFVRDAIDLKRWMMLVVLSLVPCLAFAIWNAGVQAIAYSSPALHQAYFAQSYFEFVSPRVWPIWREGLTLVLPLVFISYAVGGAWEALFACIRGHEIAEGFLVSALLYPLILPPTLPLWMAALGISVGIVIGKELFGGTGMNILNPALTCRCFLYFSFPAFMTGDVWVPHAVADGLTRASPLALFNVADSIKRIHIDAIAWRDLGKTVATAPQLQEHFTQWSATHPEGTTADFLTSGLGLTSDAATEAFTFAKLKYGLGHFSDWHLFFGDKLGSLGETSILACLLGGALLLMLRIASWRTMVSVILGAVATSLLFQLCARSFGLDGGAWNPANFDFPFYKHFLIGGLTFGLIFMATDPVSSPTMNSAKWVYGFLIGALTIVIRNVNPAYPEGVMLAILFANVFAPLFDSWALKWYRRHVA